MGIKDEKNIQVYGQSGNTMVPGSFAKAMRTCKLWQIIRFIAINIRIIFLFRKKH